MATILLRGDFGLLQKYITAVTAIPEFVNGIKMEGNTLSSIRAHCFQLRDDILPHFLDKFKAEFHGDQDFQLPAVDPKVMASRHASLEGIRGWLPGEEAIFRESIPICQSLKAELQHVVNDIDIFTREMEMEPRKPFPANDELCRCRETKFRKANQQLISETPVPIGRIQVLLSSIIQNCRDMQKLFYTIAERIDVDNTSDGELVEKHWDEGLKKYSDKMDELVSQLKP